MHLSMDLMVLTISAVLFTTIRAQNCTVTDMNAIYTPEGEGFNSLSYPNGSTVQKYCHNGFHLGGMELTCKASAWIPKDMPCTRCDPPSYWDDCSRPCSSACDWDNNCSSPKEWIECDLKNMTLTRGKNDSYGVIGRNDILELIVYVNVFSGEVNVTVTLGESTIVLNDSAMAGDMTTYIHTVPVVRASAGEYVFEAKTLYGSDLKNIAVAIYDPAAIQGIFQEDSETAIGEDGNIEITENRIDTSFTCEADGIDTPEVIWYYAGREISYSLIESRVYQSKNISSATLFIRPGTGVQIGDSGSYTCFAMNDDQSIPVNNFTDSKTIHLIVRESGYGAPVYVSYIQFLIAVTVLGVLLFLTILVFGFLAIWFRKQQYDFKKKPPINTDGRPKNKYEHHTPRGSQQTYDDVATTPSSPPNNPHPTINQPSRQTTTKPTPRRQISETPQAIAPRTIPIMPGMNTHRPDNPRQSVTAERGGQRNPAFQPNETNIYAETLYDEPVYDEPAMVTQPDYEEAFNHHTGQIYEESIQ